MKTLEQIIEIYRQKTFDGRDIWRLAAFLPYDSLNRMGVILKEGITKEMWDKEVIPFTRENIIRKLKGDVAYAFKEALEKRDMSAMLSCRVVMMWNWILEEGLENWSEKDNRYSQYFGLPLLKKTALKYNFNNPIGDDSGREEKYNN